jgi:hypothetical protein
MSPIGAPVFARVPVEARGCVPAGGSDGVLVPAPSIMLVGGLVVAPSDTVLGVEPDVVELDVGDADGDPDGDEDGDPDADGVTEEVVYVVGVLNVIFPV